MYLQNDLPSVAIEYSEATSTNSSVPASGLG